MYVGMYVRMYARMYVCMYVEDLGVRALKKSPKSEKCSARDVCASVIGFLIVTVWIRFFVCFLFFCFFNAKWGVWGVCVCVCLIRLGLVSFA